MKLLFAIKRLQNTSGGAERVLAHVTRSLVSRGHDVSVLTWDQRGAVPFYPLDPKVVLINRDIGDSAQPTRPTEFVSRVIDLRRAICSEAPDVAIGFGHSMFVPMAFALAGTGIPVVASEHAAHAHYAERRADYVLFRIAARLVSYVTVISEAIRADYTSDLRRRMVIMPNPIMVDQPVPAQRRGRLLLNVGRLDPQKDQATLIRAFGLLASRYDKWHLRILGEGHLRGELEALVAQLGLAKRVSLPGTTRDIVSAYAEADVFVLSSSYESFGLATLEAMGQDLPVVGFADCPGTNELVIHGKTGLLVDGGADRVRALAAGLEELINRPSLRSRFGLAGRDRVAELLRADTSNQRWEELLKAVVRKEEFPYAS